MGHRDVIGEAVLPWCCGADAELIGDRLQAKAKQVRELHVVNISSTYYGGGVAELLSSMTLLMNHLDVEYGWRIIPGRPDFFSITKKIHNALQGAEINLSELKEQICGELVCENAIRNHIDHDFVVVHDSQPLGLVDYYRRRGRCVWRCHVDLTSLHAALWHYLSRFILKYVAVIFSIPAYAQNLPIPQLFFMPAIDPFSTKERFLVIRLVEEYLDLFASFRPSFRLVQQP